MKNPSCGWEFPFNKKMNSREVMNGIIAEESFWERSLADLKLSIFYLSVSDKIWALKTNFGWLVLKDPFNVRFRKYVCSFVFLDTPSFIAASSWTNNKNSLIQNWNSLLNANCPEIQAVVPDSCYSECLLWFPFLLLQHYDIWCSSAFH